jgi:hypothetical protein
MMKSRFELMTFGFDTMLNHHLPQRFKLIRRDEFNHLINILTLFTRSSSRGKGRTVLWV